MPELIPTSGFDKGLSLVVDRHSYMVSAATVNEDFKGNGNDSLQKKTKKNWISKIILMLFKVSIISYNVYLIFKRSQDGDWPIL